ncbi:hypothetical protein [Desulfocurvus vexinensis]|uniref:hypothetical protein n=1 Tax=Desulfocurvus vexinensis TaxID=399548 RepID=UPI00048E9FC9|nr:hypothetical protein [Desulfocurvus vexinensis]
MNNHGLFPSGGRLRALAAALALGLALAPAQAQAGNATAPDRPPKSFGTGGENIQIGRDPETGNNVMRVGPAPRPEQPEYQVPPVEVRPEVRWPPRKK